MHCSRNVSAKCGSVTFYEIPTDELIGNILQVLIVGSTPVHVDRHEVGESLLCHRRPEVRPQAFQGGEGTLAGGVGGGLYQDVAEDAHHLREKEARFSWKVAEEHDNIRDGLDLLVPYGDLVRLQLSGERLHVEVVPVEVQNAPQMSGVVTTTGAAHQKVLEGSVCLVVRLIEPQVSF
ncbi:hypothetical protein DPMN_162683 [Dreissena polymorpha]|uniref:Uncharacterized protein n=1 Tax=Dreissena polymorpha TaxID=45954 RepID=A0A9D4EQ11_DREPO|nr:hypothetical protein DPMN_162683 [Dreissena polymorpha]